MSDNKKKRWLVQSGDLERTVRASSAKEAGAVAIRAEAASPEPSKLGQVMAVIEIVGDAELWYVLTEECCKAAGKWVDK